MRTLLVAFLLLVGLLAVPSASAVPNCLDDPDTIDCTADYVQGRINFLIDDAQRVIDEVCGVFYPPFC